MTDELQLDIFGNEVPVENVSAAKPKETIRQRWRKMYGYDESHKCVTCRFICAFHGYDGETAFKCNLMGISEEEDTNIQPGDPSCKRWRPAKEEK